VYAQVDARANEGEYNTERLREGVILLLVDWQKEIEVLLNEIFMPILDMRHSTIRQKSILLGVFIRLCQDPQALVEIYINYDCDRSSLENIYEKLINIVSRIGQTHFAPPPKEEQQGSSKQASGSSGPAIPPSLSTAALAPDSQLYAGMPPEIKLRRQSLECLVAALKSLAAWSTDSSTRGDEPRASISEDGLGRNMLSATASNADLQAPVWPAEGSRSPALTNGKHTPVSEQPSDDVDRFESAKQRKTNLLEGIKQFNFKPKRGIAYLVEHGFIKSKAPNDIARFLLSTDGLSKAMIGEYLGEGWV
jgi:brefeldin A-inhibited guanine nucleotide-exchange protein